MPRRPTAADWSDLLDLGAELAAAEKSERAISRRRRAAASAAGTIAIFASVALFATCFIANTRSAGVLLAATHRAVAPGLSFHDARRLLILAATLTIVTLATWLMLAVLRPGRKANRPQRAHRSQRPRAASRVQRHRIAIVLAAGVTPVLLGGILPFAAQSLPIGFDIDGNSGVGANLLDYVIGLAVPATFLSVLYFRWVSRLSGAAADVSGGARADTGARAPTAWEPNRV
jgi:hypothetical protein